MRYVLILVAVALCIGALGFLFGIGLPDAGRAVVMAICALFGILSVAVAKNSGRLPTDFAAAFIGVILAALCGLLFIGLAASFLYTH